jgi:hypothetical protein
VRRSPWASAGLLVKDGESRIVLWGEFACVALTSSPSPIHPNNPSTSPAAHHLGEVELHTLVFGFSRPSRGGDSFSIVGSIANTGSPACGGGRGVWGGGRWVRGEDFLGHVVHRWLGCGITIHL